MTGNIVFDIDGVILLGHGAVPGAGEALEVLRRRGFRMVVATNNATRTPQQAADRIESVTGFRFDPESIVTSSIALAGMLGPGDQPVLAVAEPGMAATLEARGVAVTGDPAAAATVAVGLDRSFSYDKLAEASRAVLGGARFIASNTDASFPTPDGFEPGAGALVAAIETAAGRLAEVAGKPHRPMRTAVSALLGPGPVWIIGDRPETDLAFGKAAGWQTILALTGVIRDPSEVPGEWAPDFVIGTISELPALLDQNR